MNKIILKRREYLIGDFQKIPIEKQKQIEKKQIENIEKLKFLNDLTIAEVKIKYNNILELCKAYNQEGNVRFKDKKIKKIVLESLKFLRVTYYNLFAVEKMNWWQWEIGIPLLLNDIFILMDEEEFQNEKKENLIVSRYFQKDPRYSGNNPVAIHPTNNPFRKSTGGNRVDTVKISLFRSLLLNDEEEFILSLKSLPEVWEYNEDLHTLENDTQRDGFYKDGTFIQHGSIGYNGTYGNVLLQGIGEIMYVIGDSKYIEFLGEKEKLKEIIKNCYEPFMYNGAFPDMLNGRAITRENSFDKTIGHMLLNSIMLIAFGLNDEELKSFVASEILRYVDYSYFENELSPFMFSLANNIIENKGKIKYKETVKICNTMNRIFIKNEERAIAIAGHSKYISNYESFNGENLRGWYTGDGMIYIYTKDVTFKEYWHNVDSRYLPGTTEVYEYLEGVNTSQHLGENMSKAERVRAIENEGKIIYFMEFINHNESLKVYKTYIYTKDSLICLNTNISSDKKVYTTLENRLYKKMPLISKEENKIKVNNIVFKSISNHKLNIEVEEKEVGYFVRIWIDHLHNENVYYIIDFEEKNKEISIREENKNLEIKYDNNIFKINNDEEKEVLTLE
ncbi:polysaccharide lyase family 8 super-sandwich domain-containing protein [Streptobacillus canis]|uniref:polysaccharide lyase family 8 super-sandwich domain-containing protein n=1 Tax=Streptobacillus canis TaxID=2678686 RepID=UPI0012E28D8F|nr:polysaccharide lyase family 8 super-sandwich domain-containing protein [Streptobacillus canis]